MDDGPSDLLNAYATREAQTTPSHPVLMEAAHDVRLTTSFLVEGGVEDERAARQSEEDGPASPALLVLQQRANPEVLEAALALLDRDDPAARQLGTRVLRELPGLYAAPYPHSPQVIDRLARLARVEQDEEVLAWALAAIGWQCHPAATEVLLGYVGDERAFVRRVVGNNLMMAHQASAPAAVAQALLILACDPDDDIRWSVFYDLAEGPDLFAAHREAFRAAARSAMDDPVDSVRKQAGRAFRALGGDATP